MEENLLPEERLLSQVEGLEEEEPDEMMEEAAEAWLRDVAFGSALGDGAIPLYGRENRKAPCRACRIDPEKSLEAGNVMATTEDAIGTLSREEVAEWCSEIVEVGNGRCRRARGIRQAAQECKALHPGDTRGFVECYAPRFSAITRRP